MTNINEIKKDYYYKCTHCGDEIFWNTHKKLIKCKCGAIYVDGCDDYVRIGGNVNDYKMFKKPAAKKVLMNKKMKEANLPPFGQGFDNWFDSDKESDINDYYYDALELLGGGKREIKKAIELLKVALKMNKDYVQTYIGFICAYGAAGDKKKTEEAINVAYEKTLKKFLKWPKRMEWGEMDNRAYMRAVQYKGELYWDNGQNEKAIELFRLLLKLNPNDNQGVRYEIAALYAGLTGKDVNRMCDEGDQKQDWSEQENLLKEQNKKHKFWKEPKC